MSPGKKARRRDTARRHGNGRGRAFGKLPEAVTPGPTLPCEAWRTWCDSTRVFGVVAIALLLFAAPVAAEEPPSPELLEFLGSFETASGKFIDPTQLESSGSGTPRTPEAAAEASADAEEKTDE